jgi:hypothetical protein
VCEGKRERIKRMVEGVTCGELEESGGERVEWLVEGWLDFQTSEGGGQGFDDVEWFLIR